MGGYVLTDINRNYALKYSIAQSDEVWCRSTHSTLPVILSVQPIDVA